MTTRVIMPQFGESVVEGTVSEWLKRVGDTVQEYEPLVEISTDKVTSEIPSPAAGTILEIYVQAGETVQTGTLLCVIGEADEKPPANTRRNGQQGVQAVGEKSTHLTPVVARMVAEHNIDINLIAGTGSGGRITKKDVQAYLDTRKSDTTADISPWEKPGSGDLFKPAEMTGAGDVAAPAAGEVAPRLPARAVPVEAVPQGADGELIRLSAVRQQIAAHMVRSKLQTAPHVTTVMEVDMSSVLAHLDTHKPDYTKQGVNLTLTAYFVQAMVAACQAVPVINSRWTDDGIFIHYPVHVGMAVAIDDGLIVPVIKNAEGLNLMGTARKVNDLAQRARSKTLQPDEAVGGTITLTNHGVSGSLFATPIINQPNTAIMGVGLMEKRVKVINDAIAIRPCCYISLTFDHRVADGASADAWLMTVKNTLENWS